MDRDEFEKVHNAYLDKIRISPEKAKELMQLHNHKFHYCSMCGGTVLCGGCGTNMCGGSNTDGCKLCEEAYAISQVAKYPRYYNIRWYIEDRIIHRIQLHASNLL